MDPARGRGPWIIEIILKLLLSIWKKIDFQGFLGIDVSREGVSKKRPKDVSREKNRFVSLPLPIMYSRHFIIKIGSRQYVCRYYKVSLDT